MDEIVIRDNGNGISKADFRKKIFEIGTDVKVQGKWIGKSVHGLSLGEIALLRKHKKLVYIKQGIPFVPAFLFALS